MRTSPFAEPAMAGIDIQHKHSLSLAKARKGVEDVARKLADKFGFEYGWDGDEMHFNRSGVDGRSEEHTSELQSLMRISYAVFCLKKKHKTTTSEQNTITNIQ